MRFERLKREALRERKELEREREEKVIVYEKEEMGFVVQVQGLVFGTSGEDVQVKSTFSLLPLVFVPDSEHAHKDETDCVCFMFLDGIRFVWRDQTLFHRR